MWYASFIPGFMFESKNIKKLNQFKNKTEAQNQFMRLLNLSINRFKWYDLPFTCNERFLEMMLCLNGWACFKETPEGIQSLGYLPKQFNIYGESVTGTAFGFFGNSQDVRCYIDGSIKEGTNGVVCRCNTLNYPIINYIRIYADRLADLMRSMDIVQRQLKAPYLITCEESQVASMQKIINDTQENKIAIIGSKMIDRDAFQVINTGVQPANLQVLRDQYREVENMFLTIIGISNVGNSVKKERMVVAEAESTYQVTNDYIYMELEARRKFCDTVNERFGLNISVEPNEATEYQTSDEIMYEEEDSYENIQ